MLGLIGTCAYARLRNSSLESLWRANYGRRAKDSDRAYNLALLRPPAGCALVERFGMFQQLGCGEHLHIQNDWAAPRGDAHHCPTVVADALAAASRGGGAPPLAAVQAAWAAAAEEIRINPSLEVLVGRRALSGATCVHLRRGDKMARAAAARRPLCAPRAPRALSPGAEAPRTAPAGFLRAGRLAGGCRPGAVEPGVRPQRHGRERADDGPGVGAAAREGAALQQGAHRRQPRRFLRLL